MRYSFEIQDDEDNTHFFQTQLGIYYAVKFRPSAYMLGEEKVYSQHSFEFIIELVYNPLDRKPPLDKLVSKTIAAIIEDFYLKKDKSVCIYICDSSDGKQDIRRKKFDEWFYNQNYIGLMKFDEIIVDSKNNRFPLSLIIKKDNPYFIEIITDFAKLAQTNSKTS